MRGIIRVPAIISYPYIKCFKYGSYSLNSNANITAELSLMFFFLLNTEQKWNFKNIFMETSLIEGPKHPEYITRVPAIIVFRSVVNSSENIAANS